MRTDGWHGPEKLCLSNEIPNTLTNKTKNTFKHQKKRTLHKSPSKISTPKKTSPPPLNPTQTELTSPKRRLNSRGASGRLAKPACTTKKRPTPHGPFRALRTGRPRPPNTRKSSTNTHAGCPPKRPPASRYFSSPPTLTPTIATVSLAPAASSSKWANAQPPPPPRVAFSWPTNSSICTTASPSNLTRKNTKRPRGSGRE